MENLYKTLLNNISYTIKKKLSEGIDFNDLDDSDSDDGLIQAIHTAVKPKILEKFIQDLCGDSWRFNKIDDYTYKIGSTINSIDIEYTNNTLVLTYNYYIEPLNRFLQQFIDVLNKKEYHIISNYKWVLPYKVKSNKNEHGLINLNLSLFNRPIEELPVSINTNDQISKGLQLINDTKSDNIITEELLDYLDNMFDDISFIGLQNNDLQFVTNTYYRPELNNVTEYLKDHKLKCSAADYKKNIQRVEDIIKKAKGAESNKLAESQAAKIGEAAKSKAGYRYVAALRLLNMPLPPFSKEFINDNVSYLRSYYSGYKDYLTIKPYYFLLRYLELGGTMEDIYYMYESTFDDAANIEARQQRIDNFSGATTSQYGRLKTFVTFLDSLDKIKYSVDPISAHITRNWSHSSNDVWQGVTLYDLNNNEIGHFAITSSNGAIKGNGDIVGRYRIGGGWRTGKYGQPIYRSDYAPEYAHNGNWRMEGSLQLYKISDSMKPFLSEGDIDLTKLRVLIKKFLKSINML